MIFLTITATKMVALYHFHSRNGVPYHFISYLSNTMPSSSVGLLLEATHCALGTCPSKASDERINR